MECGVVYCHSDGNLQGANNLDNNPDFAGPAASHVEDDSDTITGGEWHPTYPDWNNPATVTCGSTGTSCHFAGDEDSTLPDIEHPNTNAHTITGDIDADQVGWKGDAYDTWCFLCHYSDINDGSFYYHPYGMPTHVDGDTLYDSVTEWLSPVTAGRGDPCHNGAGAWSGTYGGDGCN